MHTSEPKVCVFCKNTGKTGAEWELVIGETRQPVHRPCGEKLAEFAPAEVSAKVEPSRELKRKWREQRDIKRFWSDKLQGAGFTLPSTQRESAKTV